MGKIEEIRAEMVTAMKNKDKDRKDTLSMLLAALKNKAIDKEFHHIGASAARDGHSCFLRMCMIHKVMY